MTDAYDTLATQYNKAAPRWWQKLERMSYPAAFRDLITETLPDDQSHPTVLDAGTGCGDFALALLDIHCPASVDLLDISSDMLASAAARVSPHITPTLLHQPLENLSSQKYDLILCAHVIEHCPDPLVALRTLRQALKPNGKLLLTVSKPHICTALIQFMWRYRAYRPTKIAHLLSAAGYRDIQITPFKTGVPARVSCGYLALT